MSHKKFRLPVEWTKGLRSDEERTQRTKTVLSHTKDEVLRVLVGLIEDKKKEVESKYPSKESYESPSWAYLQAHLNGEQEVLKWLEGLLSFVDHEQTKGPTS